MTFGNLSVTLFFFACGTLSAARSAATECHVLDLTAPLFPAVLVPNSQIARNSHNDTLFVTNTSLVLNGAPIFPIAGEYHYSRALAGTWAADLGILRAAGITVISTYAFWIHHEEIRGALDWSGSRNLTAFLVEAQAAGLLVSLRIGPYAHGEARNGGLPDWVIEASCTSTCHLRANTSAWMALSEAWYVEVAKQLRGMLWQQGGPVITVQLENEESDGTYLVALRDAALRQGIAPPFFTTTGLNVVPLGSMLPLSGRYAVAFWASWNAKFRESEDYLFQAAPFANTSYAPLYCELGAGMQSAYHFRVDILPRDVAADATVAFAASANLGYYMLHGGRNPVSNLTSLNEQQAAPWHFASVYDLPVSNYDFSAPISEAGEPHGQLPALRALHSLAGDPLLGPWLAATTPVLPPAGDTPASVKDGATLRWAARSDGAGGGFLFFNAWAQKQALDAHVGVRFNVTRPASAGGLLHIPALSSLGFNVTPAAAAFFFPLRPPLPPPLVLDYALAQPLAWLPSANKSKCC